MKLSDKAKEKMVELIPEHMHGAVVRYFEEHIAPGHFLTAVLAGDLFEAVARADEKNKAALPNYVMWLYNYVPGRPNGWGSYEAVFKWAAEREVA